MGVRELALAGLALAASAALGPAAAQAPRGRATQHVVLVVTDGLRWQEVFGGADSLLMNRPDGGVQDTAALRRDFWRATAEERRRALLPFFWDSIARRGQLYGNRAKGSEARVTNGLKFSYPGYNEMLAGHPDPRIDRNAYGPNPNLTVFGWLARQPGFSGRVSALATWGAFADIFDRARSGVHVRAGWEPPVEGTLTPRQALLDALYRTTTRLWPDNVFDALTHQAILDHVRTRRPRVLFVGYGETDEWAHAGRYDLLLRSAHQVDRFVAELWATMQAMPEYRGRTTLVITTDHGRGGAPRAWRDHGRDVGGAEDIWVAVLGPDTPPLGERGADAEPVTQAQIAATVAALLGLDYRAAVPTAAPAMRGVVR